MNRSKALLLVFLFAAFSLSSCSGPKGRVICTVNCGGSGSVIATVTSTPSQTFFFPYLEWAISSVQLTNTSGSATIVQGALPPVDFARLQTDSQFLGKALSAVPAGTYTSATIQLKPSTAASYFYNGSTATLLGCAPATVCQIPNTVPGFGATTVTAPVNFTVIANSNVGFSLNFDLSKAVTSAGGMTFDFTQTGAITLTTLPRQGQSSGSLDSLENFTGTVTATTATSFSMSSLSSDTRTFTMAATVEFDDPFTICTTANFNCIAVNQNISVDAFINSDGTLTAYEVEFLDKTAQEAEGIIVTPVTNNQFKMVVTNGMGTTFLPGTLATVNVSNAAGTYFVDPKNLLGVSTTPTLGFSSSTDLVVGQTVMLQGGSVNFTNNSLSGYTRTLLRYSSISGTIQSTSGTNLFTLSGVSPFFTNLATNSVQAQTFTNTTYDGITGGFSGLSNVTNGASVRGLYLNPTSGATQPLLAAKVRAH
jgi:hypothetical protein